MLVIRSSFHRYGNQGSRTCSILPWAWPQGHTVEGQLSRPRLQSLHCCIPPALLNQDVQLKPLQGWWEKAVISKDTSAFCSERKYCCFFNYQNKYYTWKSYLIIGNRDLWEAEITRGSYFKFYLNLSSMALLGNLGGTSYLVYDVDRVVSLQTLNTGLRTKCVPNKYLVCEWVWI